MARTADRARKRVVVGRVVGLHGLDGWMKVHSYTDPRDRLGDYTPLHAGDRALKRCRVKAHRKGLLLRAEGCADRTAVEALVGEDIWVWRDQLPPPGEGAFYHVDLEGLRVVNRQGQDLGRVERVVPGAGNDVLVVLGERERLIPLTLGHAVLDVQLDAGVVTVDWDLDW